ncbi:MAG: NAD-dependent deacylase [Candidatus Alcyoniella australis]|nr:NAD-dependent deacylase [Candidatus Alcyoniella australis]
MDVESVKRAARLLSGSHHVIALTGAGISTDSGIPDFRSPGGLWDRFNPMEYATIEAFSNNPAKVYQMIKELHLIVERARPNPGHLALARLEQMGMLKAVITQNIDNLHQDAGNKKVIEFHGNGSRLICLNCQKTYGREDYEESLESDELPMCSCGAVLKPDVVFFGEPIPVEASMLSQHEAQNCDCIMVIGTSATVAPASHIPFIAKRAGAAIVEFNTTRTALTDSLADLFVQGSSSETLAAVADRLKLIGED